MTGKGKNVTEETEVQRRFDAAASGWDEEPRRVKLADEIAAAILGEGVLGADMDVLDYGCGTGLLTLRLQPHVRSITGADTSPGMLDVLDGKIRKSGLGNVSTLCLNLETGDVANRRFHAIVSSMTLHHVRDTGALIAKLHSLLLPGGYLCIADLDKEDGSFHDDMAGVEHFGFERQGLEEMFRAAGFTAVRSRVAATIMKRETVAYPVNLVTGRK
ncbi:MAG: methyltransferase domain-containing protein [Geobacter sp.]|nr:methyltransferase domain-containing protein [Geobacter sp.]